jgi:hypothetical protein
MGLSLPPERTIIFMGKLFATAFSPITVLWAFAESRIWMSIIGAAVLAAVSLPLGFGTVGVCALLVLSVLLMRADPVLDEQAALAAARG